MTITTDRFIGTVSENITSRLGVARGNYFRAGYFATHYFRAWLFRGVKAAGIPTDRHTGSATSTLTDRHL